MEIKEQANVIAAELLGNLYQKITGKITECKRAFNPSNTAKANLIPARHDTWVEARAMTEEAIYLFLETGGC